MCKACVAIERDREQAALAEVRKWKACDGMGAGPSQSRCHPMAHSPGVCGVPSLGSSTHFSSQEFKVRGTHSASWLALGGGALTDTESEARPGDLGACQRLSGDGF